MILRLWLLYTHERIKLVEVSVDSHAASSYFSPVADWSPKYIFLLSAEKVLNYGSWEIMRVYGLILEEDNVTKSWSGWVLFSTYYVWVDLVPLAFSESKEYMVGCEGDSQGSTQDWGPIVELVNDQVNPGQEFFIVHLQLVRARARFTNRMGLKISAWQNKNEGYTVCKT